MWHLDENSRAITRVRFAAAGTAMLHPFKHGERITYNLVRLISLYVGDETNTTGVFLKVRVIQSLLLSFFQFDFLFR
jgi:hypothetical protein